MSLVFRREKAFSKIDLGTTDLEVKWMTPPRGVWSWWPESISAWGGSKGMSQRRPGVEREGDTTAQDLRGQCQDSQEWCPIVSIRATLLRPLNGGGGPGLIKCFLPVPAGRGSEWWLVNAHWIELNSIKLNWSKGMPFLSPRRGAGSAEGAILQQWSKACTCTGPSPLATRRAVPRRGLLEMDQWNQKPKFLVRV